jgi:hypothetical protein
MEDSAVVESLGRNIAALAVVESLGRSIALAGKSNAQLNLVLFHIFDF